jgi:hypothetical protein
MGSFLRLMQMGNKIPEGSFNRLHTGAFVRTPIVLVHGMKHHATIDLEDHELRPLVLYNQ